MKILIWLILISGYGFCGMNPDTLIGDPTLCYILSIEGCMVSPNDVTKLNEEKTIILKEGDKYFWLSRNNIELMKIKSGVFTIYTTLNGSGFVKICDLNGSYMEQVHLGLSTWTYYGQFR